MAIETLPFFAAAVFILAVLPGPGVFLTVARAISGGFNHALLAVAGILVGDLIFILLATLGLKIIAVSLSVLFVVIKYAGGAYLIWLGLSLLLSKPNKNRMVTSANNKTTYMADFLAGLTITLSNPKAIFFYLSFLPAFVNIQNLSGIDIVIISLMVISILGSVMLFYAIAAIKAQQLTGTKTSSPWIQKIAGGLMISTGGILISRT